MLARRLDGGRRTRPAGDRAGGVGRRRPPSSPRPRIQRGTALMMTGAGEGITEIERRRGHRDGTGRRPARRARTHADRLRAWVSCDGTPWRVPALSTRRSPGAADHDLVTSEWYCTAWLARCDLEQGRWDEAAACCRRAGAHAALRRASPVSSRSSRSAGARPARRPRRRRPARRGARARPRAPRTCNGCGRWPRARAEAAWLAGRPDAELDARRRGAGAWPRDLDYARADRGAGVLATPRRRRARSPWSGCSPTGRATGAGPSRRSGWRRAATPVPAADGWAQVGCPYEQAMAMLLAGERESLTAALAIAGRARRVAAARPCGGRAARRRLARAAWPGAAPPRPTRRASPNASSTCWHCWPPARTQPGDR